MCSLLHVTLALLTAQPASDRIQPWDENPRYWQHQGQPVLLLGGSKDDSLFQIPDLEEHLDLLASVGGNVIRNTMSDRPDHGFEVYPYARRDDGRYDLDRWNDEYWARFARMLQLTEQRGIIVQIEVWDRFDYAQENWAAHPYNPANNVNYTVEGSGLATDYPEPAWLDRQPFFHTIPGMPLYTPELDVVRAYQERFVRELLSHSLPYGNVLYCVDNETSTPVEWGQHWMALIHQAGDEAGLPAFVTDMFDDAYEPQNSAKLRAALDRPDLYSFLDISQINSRSFGEDQWDRLMWVREQISAHPRPLNNTKIYSDGQTVWGSGTPQDGIERFWRNLLAGAASCRFHRDGAGIGLNRIAQRCIRAARQVHETVPLWTLEPRIDLLSDRDRNEAYLAADPESAYVLFFPAAGEVTVDLSAMPGGCAIHWMDIQQGGWVDAWDLEGGGRVPIRTPRAGAWAAIITPR